MFRGSVKGPGYPLHSPFSPSLPLPCVIVCHHVSTGLYGRYGTEFCGRYEGSRGHFEHRTSSTRLEHRHSINSQIISFSSFLAPHPLEFGHVFPYDKYPVCSVQSSCSPSFYIHIPQVQFHIIHIPPFSPNLLTNIYAPNNVH